jgi:hypothetical protein
MSTSTWVVACFFHQHFQLPSSPDRLPLPMIVHVDQRQGGFFVQLVDLGNPLLQLLVAVGVVVPFPRLGVSPPCLEVVNANNKRRLF